MVSIVLEFADSIRRFHLHPSALQCEMEGGWEGRMGRPLRWCRKCHHSEFRFPSLPLELKISLKSRPLPHYTKRAIIEVQLAARQLFFFSFLGFGLSQAHRLCKGKNCLRGDFVGGISAHHVQNGQAASGMIRHPRVEAQNIVLEDDNDVPIGNHGINLLLSQDAITVHFGSRHVGKGSWAQY